MHTCGHDDGQKRLAWPDGRLLWSVHFCEEHLSPNIPDIQTRTRLMLSFLRSHRFKCFEINWFTAFVVVPNNRMKFYYDVFFLHGFQGCRVCNFRTRVSVITRISHPQMTVLYIAHLINAFAHDHDVLTTHRLPSVQKRPHKHLHIYYTYNMWAFRKVRPYSQHEKANDHKGPAYQIRAGMNELCRSR